MNPTKEVYAIRSHWNYFYTDLENLTELVKEIDPKHKANAVKKYSDIKQEFDQMRQFVANQALYKVGRLNVESELSTIITLLRGIPDAVEYDDFTNIVKDIISSIVLRLENIKNEVSKKADIFNSLELMAPPKQVPEPIVDKDASYDSFMDAMKIVMNNMKSQEKEGIQKIISPEQRLFNKIKDESEKSTERMKEALLSLGNNAHVITQGSLIINHSLNKKNIEGMSYSEVQTPGVKYGFKRRESLPSHYVLHDQIIVGIKIQVGRFMFSKKGDLSDAERKDRTGKMLQLLRDEAKEKLEKSLKSPIIDTLIYYPTPFLVSPNFPGIKFIWMTKISDFKKIGSIPMDKIRLSL